MRLFTKEIDKKLAAQYHLGADLNAQVVVAKIFNPYGNGRWYLINSDPSDPDYLWAIVQIGDIVEVGSVSRKELENLRVGRLRFPLERDLGFSQRNAQEVYNGVVSGKTYANGGVADVTPTYAAGGINEAELSKFAEALQDAEMQVYDNLDIRSGGQLYRTASLQKQYASQMNESFKELTKKFAHLKDINEEQAKLIHDMLEDQNYHGLNNYLALKGMYGQKRKEKYESYHTKYPDNYLDPANMNGAQSYAVGGLTPGRWYKDNEGIEYKFIGKVDNGPNKDQLLFTDGTQKSYKTLDEFGSKPKENKLFGWFADGGETKKIPRYRVDIHVIGHEYDEAYSKYSDSFEEAVEFSKRGNHADIYDNEKKQYIEFEKGGKTATIGEVSSMSFRNNYDDYEMVVISKELDKDGGKMVKDRFMVSAHDIDEAKKIATDLWKEQFGQTDLSIVKVMSAEAYKHNYMGKMAHGGKLNIGTIKKTDTDVYFDKQSGEFYVRVIDGLGNRVNKLKINTIDDLYKDYPTFRLNEKGQKEFKDSMAMGGTTKFADKVKSIQSSLLKRKKVAPSVQKDYGKTYNKAEAKESATRIVGAMTAKERLMAKKKMADGGLVSMQPEYKKLIQLEEKARNSAYRAKDWMKWSESTGDNYRQKWEKMVLKLRGWNSYSLMQDRKSKPEWVQFCKETNKVEDYNFGDITS